MTRINKKHKFTIHKCELIECCNFFSKPRGKRLSSQKVCTTHRSFIRRQDYENNKETYQNYMKKYYQNNKDKMKQVSENWRKNNREKWNEICRKQRVRDPERHRRLCRNSRQKYPEKQLGYLKKHFKKYSQIFDVSDKEYQYAIFAWSKTVKKILGYACVICNSTPVQSHHVFYKQYYPELSLNPNNGIPLCKVHHNEVHGKCLIGLPKPICLSF